MNNDFSLYLLKVRSQEYKYQRERLNELQEERNIIESRIHLHIKALEWRKAISVLDEYENFLERWINEESKMHRLQRRILEEMAAQ